MEKKKRMWRDSVLVFAASGILFGSLVGAAIDTSPLPEIGALMGCIIGAFLGHCYWDRGL